MRVATKKLYLTITYGGAASWLGNSSQAFDLHGLFDNNRVNLHEKDDYPGTLFEVKGRQHIESCSPATPGLLISEQI